MVESAGRGRPVVAPGTHRRRRAARPAPALIALAMAVWIIRSVTRPLDAGRAGRARRRRRRPVDGTSAPTAATRPACCWPRCTRCRTRLAQHRRRRARQRRRRGHRSARRSRRATTTCRPAPSSRPARCEQTAASMEQLGSHRAARTPTTRARPTSWRCGASTVAVQGGEVVGQVVDTMKGINDSSQEDRRHHRRDRRHRVPDQHPGAERRGRSGARRRAGPRLRGGGQRGAQPGAAQRRGGQGDQGADHRQRRARRAGHGAGRPGRRDDERGGRARSSA